jgi:phosphate transport system substrate-binding protein
VKKAHVGIIPGISEFLNEFTSESAIGEDGYLLEVGLVPLDSASVESVRSDVKKLKSFSFKQ